MGGRVGLGQTCEVGTIGLARGIGCALPPTHTPHPSLKPLSNDGTNNLEATTEENSANSNHQGNKKREHVRLFPRVSPVSSPDRHIAVSLGARSGAGRGRAF